MNSPAPACNLSVKELAPAIGAAIRMDVGAMLDGSAADRIGEVL